MKAHVLKVDVIIFVVTQHVGARFFPRFDVLSFSVDHKGILGCVAEIISENIPYIIWPLLVERYDAKLVVGRDYGQGVSWVDERLHEPNAVLHIVIVVAP